MMATAVTPLSPPATYIDPSPPQSLLLFPTLIDQTSLSDLHDQVRSRDYHAYRDAVTRVQLNELILANALVTRLATLLYYAQTLLVRLVVEHTPAHDNTSDFVLLNQAAHALKKSITTKCNTPIEETVPALLTAPTSPSAYPSPQSFLDELSPTASTTLLNFLASVRNDPSLLTSRLLQTTDQELDALISWKPNRHAQRSSTSRHSSIPTAAASPADYLLSFHRHDPLYILTSAVFSSPESSSDNRRRLNCWSTCLAHFIDEKRGDQLVLAVLDIWAGHEWKAGLPFETVILGYLQNSAKLKAKQGEDAFVADIGLPADPEMTDLLNKTLVEILEILADYGGIPWSILELVSTVLGQCADKAYAREMLFSKWFIQHFLIQNIVYPEYRGLLGESYISDDQRHSLQLLYSHFIERSSSDSIITESERVISTHLDLLKTKFFPASPTPSLLDDESDNSIQPSITLCPSDILTIFYALHSKYRPPSPSQLLTLPPRPRHNRKPSDESSGRPDILRMSSEYIRPILKKTNMFELHEDSISSQSDAPSVEESPLLQENEEIDLYGLSVKAAIDEMKRRLGADVFNGEKHFSEEVWATLYVERDGSLSRVPEFETVESVIGGGEESIISREDDAVIESALLKIAETASKSKQQPVVDNAPSWQARNSVYYNDLILLTPTSMESFPIPPSSESVLLKTIQTASSKSFTQGDYVQAQSFQHVKSLLQSITDPSLTRNDYAPILGILSRKIQRQTNRSIVQIRTRELYFSHLLSSRSRISAALPTISNFLDQLRTKMWYINSVRDSKPFTRAKEVCTALQQMKSSTSLPNINIKRNSSAINLTRSNSMQRDKRILRNSFDGFSFSARPVSLYNVSLQSEDWMDILPAPTEQGGPHKLGDYQIDVTTRWMEEHSLQNFCAGEEIIHRFCAEVDDVVRRTVPEQVDEMTSVASTFWESEVFGDVAREMGMLDVREDVPRTGSSMDVLGMLRSRGRGMEDVSDTRSIRSGHTRTTSLSVNNRHSMSQTQVRPTSSHSISFPPSPSPISSFFSRQPNPSPMTRSTSTIDEKAATSFLETTRRRLVGLLLSDLGMEMWAGGSETDEWFTDGLADSCLERKRVARRTAVSTVWGVGPRGEKKKKKAVVPGSMKPAPRRGFVIDETNDLPTPPLSRETSETGNEPATLTKKSKSDGFDFTSAYKKLFTRFSVHPSPHEKLNALYDLEQLINASFAAAALTQSHPSHIPNPHLPPTPRPSVESARSASTSSAIGTDDLIDEIQRLLRDPKTRPATLFRDLSFISAFIPPVALTHQAEGKVFWDIGLAASAVKTDVVNSMVDWYEEIMAGNERSTSRHSRSLSSGGLKDAARMLLIAACEGHAVGQRELALLHLSHPSLLPLTTLPLSRPSDTFQKVNFKSANDKDKYDPDRIALATHWFRLAAKNGDKYAKNVEGNWLGSKNF